MFSCWVSIATCRAVRPNSSCSLTPAIQSNKHNPSPLRIHDGPRTEASTLQYHCHVHTTYYLQHTPSSLGVQSHIYTMLHRSTGHQTRLAFLVSFQCPRYMFCIGVFSFSYDLEDACSAISPVGLHRRSKTSTLSSRHCPVHVGRTPGVDRSAGSHDISIFRIERKPWLQVRQHLVNLITGWVLCYSDCTVKKEVRSRNRGSSECGAWTVWYLRRLGKAGSLVLSNDPSSCFLKDLVTTREDSPLHDQCASEINLEHYICLLYYG